MSDPLNPKGGISLTKIPQVSNLLSGIKISNIPFLGDITKPYPTPPIPKQPTKTKFDKTPFSEINLVDPFKTSELSILTEDLLAVDKIGDILGKFLPPELIEELSSVKEFANHLLTQGKDMVGAVMELADKIPNGLNLAEILRDIPIMSVIENIDLVNSVASSLGIDLSSFSQDGLKSVFSFLDGFKSSGDSTAGGSDSNATSVLSSLGYTTPNIGDIAVKTAIVSGAISSIISAKVNVSNTYKNLGVNSVSSVTGVTNLLSSNGFTQLVNNVSTIGPTNVSTLAKIVPHLNFPDNDVYIKTAFTLQPDAVKLITPLTQAKLNAVRSYVSLTQQYGADVVSVSTKNLSCYTVSKLAVIRDIYVTDPTFSLNGTINQFAMYPTPEILRFQAEVTLKGVTQYALDNPRKFKDILLTVSKYGLSVIDIALSAITNINVDISSQGLTDPGLIILVDTMTTLGVSTSVKLSIIPNLALTRILSTIDTYGSSLISNTYSGIVKIIPNSINLDMITTAITTVVSLTGTFQSTQLEQTYTSLLELSPNDITIIQNKLSVTEVASLITAYEIGGLSLQFLLKETTKHAALAGDKKTILNLIGTYQGILTNDYLRYLTDTLLEHYTLTKDDICMGTKLASINLVSALNAILPNWWTTTRGSESVYNHKPFLNASSDALLLLRVNSILGIDAVIQIDTLYTTPPHLLQ